MKKDTVVTKSIKSILGGIGALVVLSIIVGILLSYIQSFVPYTLKSQDRLKNSSSFNNDFIVDEVNVFKWYKDDLKENALYVHEESGIQLYFIGLEVQEEFDSRADSIRYAKEYIEENIDDDYGIYYIQVDVDYTKTYDWDYSDSLVYGEYVYGDKVSDFMTSSVMKIYNKAFDRFYNGSTFDYYSDVECFAKGMQLTVERVAHPYMSLFWALVKTLAIVGVVAVIVKVILSIHQKHRNKQIMETPMKTLVEEELEDIMDRYE